MNELPDTLYVGVQNDSLYIIDKPPRPGPVDFTGAGAPGVTCIASMEGASREDGEIAERLVTCWNAFRGTPTEQIRHRGPRALLPLFNQVFSVLVLLWTAVVGQRDLENPNERIDDACRKANDVIVKVKEFASQTNRGDQEP